VGSFDTPLLTVRRSCLQPVQGLLHVSDGEAVLTALELGRIVELNTTDTGLENFFDEGSVAFVASV
jgi:hypothetical protein